MLQVDHNNRQPVYQQIYEQIKHDILMGKLSVGTKIASTRALAKELQVGIGRISHKHTKLWLCS